MKTALKQKTAADEKQMSGSQLHTALLTETPGQSVPTENRGILTKIKADDLPLEPADAFSSAPFDFEKTALMLWEDTLKIYDHACVENRFSEHYLKYCTQLEKSIKQVGSMCLTKAVMEKHGYDFPQLESMTVKELVGMVSFHLQKCHAAVEGLYKDNQLLGITYLDWEFRWFGLGSRLKATEVKIQKIRDGEINTDTLLKQEQTFKDEPRTNQAPANPRSLRMNPNALPLDGSMARAMLWWEAQDAKIQAKKQREEEREERELMRLGLAPKPFPTISRKQIAKEMLMDQMKKEAGAKTQKADKPETQTETITETPEPPEAEQQDGTLTEDEARLALIQRALDRGELETAREIRQEDSELFYQRWLRYVEEAEAENRRALVASGRAGPSDATRKKLREKRKKHKK